MFQLDHMVMEVGKLVQEDRMRQAAKHRQLREIAREHVSAISGMRAFIGNCLIRAGQAIAQIEHEAAGASRDAARSRAKPSLIR